MLSEIFESNWKFVVDLPLKVEGYTFLHALPLKVTTYEYREAVLHATIWKEQLSSNL